MARTVNPETHARRRAAIIAAAAEEFAAKGIDTTSTATVCRRAGIGSGTLFHYFPTKRELFHAVFAADRPKIDELCTQALDEGDPDVAVDLIIDHLVGELTAPLASGLASAAVAQANRDPEFATLLAENDEPIAEALVTILHRLPRALPFEAESAARWIQNLVDACHLGHFAGSDGPPVAELRRIIDWVLGR